jgi:succinoglycan biosynthesis transport protein ExoP
MRELVGGLVQTPTNATVLDTAKAPLSATNPQHGHPLLFGALIGLFGGIGLTFFLEYRDADLTTPQDVLHSLQLSPVSSVPDFGNRVSRSRYSLTTLLHTLTGKQQDIAAEPSGPQEKSPLSLQSGISLAERSQFLIEQRMPLVTQAYRDLCSALTRSRVEKQGTRVLFTSAVSGEGTTLTICHSALLLAEMGHKVLVIDANYRYSIGQATDDAAQTAGDWVACHSLFGAEEGPGLTNLVTGRRKQRVVKSTAIKNLFF